MKGKQRIVLGAGIAVAVLGVIVGCDGMFTAELVQETETVGVAGVSVYPKFLEIDPGDTKDQLEAQVVPANASNQLVVWKSSAPSIATVDAAGIVTAGYLDGIAVIIAYSADGEHLDSAVMVVGDDLIGKKGPAGGLIFYEDVDNEHPWRFLEAAPHDGWYDGGDEPRMAWSNVEDEAVGTTSEAIGSGQANSAAIIAQPGHTESAARVAAEFVHVHTGVSYGDWFLPSLDELNVIFENLHHEGIGGFQPHPSVYWSSSESFEIGDRFAYMVDPIGPIEARKGQVLLFRPIRAF